MTWTTEIETDAVTEDELDELATQAHTCNGFAFDYVENHENAVVKDGLYNGSQEHCYVYDADRDVTIDVTLGQFGDTPTVGAWDGDHHPYIADHEEVYEWTDREAFKEEYDYVGSPFIL